MISLGISASSLRSLNSYMTSSHDLRVVVQILDLNHKFISDVTPHFIDGQVNIDRSAEIVRSLTVSFFDPLHRMGLDAYSPSDGALFVDRMLAVYYIISPPGSDTEWVIPVFTGPITKLDRDWTTVSVECQGKEVLSLSPSWVAKTYKKGALKVSVIKDLLQLTGETKFTLPTGTTSRTTTAIAVSNESKPWELAKNLAAGMGYQLFYNGRGVATMRPWPRTPSWTYYDEGTGASVMTKPQVGYDVSKLINAVIVQGVVVKGKKKSPLIYKKYAPKSHPLNPYALGRNGVGRFLFTTIKDDNINSVAEADAVASDTLERGLIEAVTASFDAYPIPHLEEGDVYRLDTGEFATTARLNQMAIPLSAGGKSTIGYLRNVSRPNKRTIRRNRR